MNEWDGVTEAGGLVDATGSAGAVAARPRRSSVAGMNRVAAIMPFKVGASGGEENII